MRGPKLFLFFPLEIGKDKKKKVFMSADVVFSLKISLKTEKKGFSLFVLRPLIFSEALGFSLLSLYVNPAQPQADGQFGKS